MTDTLPIISQIKSILQLLFGQTSRALETQINFIDATPLLSQLKSLYQIFVNRDLIQAKETQKKFLIITNATIDGIPLVGHIKGLGHYIIGDYNNGHNALKRSSRTTVVILSAYFACTIFIPNTATIETTITVSSIGSMIGGLAIDTLISLFSTMIGKNGSLYGIWYKLEQIIKNPWDIGNLFDFIIGPILDGLIGAFIGLKISQSRNVSLPQTYTKSIKSKYDPPTKQNQPPIPYIPSGKLGIAVTKTINAFLPPPHHAFSRPISRGILHPRLPLPVPLNPWIAENIDISKQLMVEGLRYGGATSVLQRHVK